MRSLLVPMLLSLALTSGGWSQSPADRLKIEVMVISHFAHNYGMMPEAVMFQGEKYSLQEAAAAILPSLGWENQEWRSELALAWVEKVEMIGISPLDPKEIEVETKDDGSVDVTLWVKLPTGNHPAAFSRHRYTFSPQGAVTMESIDSRRAGP